MSHVRVISHIMSHVARTQMRHFTHMWMQRVIHVNKSRHICEWVMPQTWQCVMSHIRLSHVTHMWLRRVTRMRMSHDTHMCLSHVTHLRMSQVTYSNESCHTYVHESSDAHCGPSRHREALRCHYGGGGGNFAIVSMYSALLLRMRTGMQKWWISGFLAARVGIPKRRNFLPRQLATKQARIYI